MLFYIGFRILQRYSQYLCEIRVYINNICNSKTELNIIDNKFIHDLSTPVSSLNCVLEIAENGKSSSEVVKQAKFSLKQIHKLITSTKEILGSKNSNENFNITHEIKSCLKIFNHSFDINSIDAKVIYSGNIYINGNKVIFNRIIINLIKNSFEELLSIQHKKKEILVSIRNNGSVVEITISDNGRGFNMDEITNVFNEGFSTKVSTGLGLSFCKNALYKYFDGEIFIERVESGSKVLIKIPLV